MSWWLAILIGSPLTSTLEGGEDLAAQRLVERWRQTLRETKQISVEFRIRVINSVFETDRYRVGEYFRNRDCWIMRRLPQPEVPASGLNPANVRNRAGRYKEIEPIMPLTIHSAPDALWIDNDGTMECDPWLPASALTPENVSSQGFFELLARSFRSALSEHAMPLYFVTTGDCGHYKASLLQKNGHVWLRFTRKPWSLSSTRFETVEAVFHPNENLPFAIRTISSSGAVQRQMFLDTVRLNDEAQIPHDVLKLLTTPSQAQLR